VQLTTAAGRLALRSVKMGALCLIGAPDRPAIRVESCKISISAVATPARWDSRQVRHRVMSVASVSGCFLAAACSVAAVGCFPEPSCSA